MGRKASRQVSRAHWRGRRACVGDRGSEGELERRCRPSCLAAIGFSCHSEWGACSGFCSAETPWEQEARNSSLGAGVEGGIPEGWIGPGGRDNERGMNTRGVEGKITRARGLAELQGRVEEEKTGEC